jgi:N-acetyltransferase 10
LNYHLSHHDLQRLELYSRNMVDHHMIVDLLPSLAKFVFLGRLRGFRLSYLQVAILLATGLQNRNVDEISIELDLPVNQVLAFFNKTIRKISSYLKAMVEAHVASTGTSSDAVLQRMEKKALAMASLKDTLQSDHRKEESEFKKQQREVLMKSKDLSKHAITADISDLSTAMDKSVKKQKDVPASISVAKATSNSFVLPPLDEEEDQKEVEEVKGEKKKKHKKRHQDDAEDNGIEKIDTSSKKKKHKKFD